MLFELDKSNTIKVCQSGAILAGSCQDEWLKQPFMYKLGWDDTRTIMSISLWIPLTFWQVQHHYHLRYSSRREIACCLNNCYGTQRKNV